MDRSQLLLKRAAALGKPQERRARRGPRRAWQEFEAAVALLIERGHALAAIASWMIQESGKKSAYKSARWWSAYKAAARHRRRLEAGNAKVSHE